MTMARRQGSIFVAVTAAFAAVGLAAGVLLGLARGDDEDYRPPAEERTLVMPTGVQVRLPEGFVVARLWNDEGDYVRIGRGTDATHMESYVDYDYHSHPPKVLNRENVAENDRAAFAAIEEDLGQEPPAGGTASVLRDGRQVWLIPPDPPDPSELPTVEPRGTREPSENPFVRHDDWRTFPVANGTVDLPPGFRTLQTVSVVVPVEGEVPWSGNTLGILGPPAEQDEIVSSLGWELETGRVTRYYVAPDLEDLFVRIREQLAAAYGVQELPYLPGVPERNTYGEGSIVPAE